MTILETFKKLSSYWLSQITEKEPSCFNGMVMIEKYKITIEKIEEPKEVYQKRLQKLWSECDNHHHWRPLKDKANKLGIELEGSAGSGKTKS